MFWTSLGDLTLELFREEEALDRRRGPPSFRPRPHLGIAMADPGRWCEPGEGDTQRYQSRTDPVDERQD